MAASHVKKSPPFTFYEDSARGERLANNSANFNNNASEHFSQYSRASSVSRGGARQNPDLNISKNLFLDYRTREVIGDNGHMTNSQFERNNSVQSRSSAIRKVHKGGIFFTHNDNSVTQKSGKSLKNSIRNRIFSSSKLKNLRNKYQSDNFSVTNVRERSENITPIQAKYITRGEGSDRKSKLSSVMTPLQRLTPIKNDYNISEQKQNLKKSEFNLNLNLNLSPIKRLEGNKRLNSQDCSPLIVNHFRRMDSKVSEAESASRSFVKSTNRLRKPETLINHAKLTKSNKVKSSVGGQNHIILPGFGVRNKKRMRVVSQHRNHPTRQSYDGPKVQRSNNNRSFSKKGQKNESNRMIPKERNSPPYKLLNYQKHQLARSKNFQEAKRQPSTIRSPIPHYKILNDSSRNNPSILPTTNREISIERTKVDYSNFVSNTSLVRRTDSGRLSDVDGGGAIVDMKLSKAFANKKRADNVIFNTENGALREKRDSARSRVLASNLNHQVNNQSNSRRKVKLSNQSYQNLGNQSYQNLGNQSHQNLGNQSHQNIKTHQNKHQKLGVSPDVNITNYQSHQFHSRLHQNRQSIQQLNAKEKPNLSMWFSNVFKSKGRLAEPIHHHPQAQPQQKMQESNIQPKRSLQNHSIPGFDSSPMKISKKPSRRSPPVPTFHNPSKPNRPMSGTYMNVSHQQIKQNVQNQQQNQQNIEEISRHQQHQILNENHHTPSVSPNPRAPTGAQNQNHQKRKNANRLLNYHFNQKKAYPSGQKAQKDKNEKFSFDIGKTFGNFAVEFGKRENSRGYKEGIRQSKKNAKWSTSRTDIQQTGHQRVQKNSKIGDNSNKSLFLKSRPQQGSKRPASNSRSRMGQSSSREPGMRNNSKRHNLLAKGFLPERTKNLRTSQNRKENLNPGRVGGGPAGHRVDRIGLFDAARKKLGLGKNRKSYYL